MALALAFCSAGCIGYVEKTNQSKESESDLSKRKLLIVRAILRLLSYSLYSQLKKNNDLP